MFGFILLLSVVGATAQTGARPDAASADALRTDAPAVSLPDFSALPKADVVRVLDGDTVILRWGGKERKCRLWGVDTPETIAQDRSAEPYGLEASRFLMNLLSGERVWVAVNRDGMRNDVYDRLLVYLFRAPDGLFVNLEILRQGYGRAFTSVPFPYLEIFKTYESRARAAGKGIWGADAAAMTRVSPPPAAAPADPAQNPPSAAGDSIVYVTRSGESYHRDGCRFLAKSRAPLTLGEIRGRYKPCSVCKPPL
jgi:micrococcal nuclease